MKSLLIKFLISNMPKIFSCRLCHCACQYKTVSTVDELQDKVYCRLISSRHKLAIFVIKGHG